MSETKVGCLTGIQLLVLMAKSYLVSSALRRRMLKELGSVYQLVSCRSEQPSGARNLGFAYTP